MKRIPQLDGVRALAITAVFLHHALKLKVLWMGVDLFFILSGFLITGVLLRSRRYSLGGYLAHFYNRRVRRILAPYLVTLALGSLFFGLAWTRHWYFYVMLTNLVLPLRIPHPKAFEPLWSLAVEEQFYLLWPFAVYFLSDKRLRQLSWVLVLMVPLLRLSLHFGTPWHMYTLTPFRMDLLATGALLCFAFRDHREAIERWGAKAGFAFVTAGLALLAVLGYFGVSTYGNTRTSNLCIYEAALFVGTGIMLWALSGRGVSLLQSAPLVHLGRISYTAYLVHMGILVLVWKWLQGGLGAVCAAVLTVLYSSLSWYLMERPLLNPGTSHDEQKSSAAAVTAATSVSVL